MKEMNLMIYETTLMNRDELQKKIGGQSNQSDQLVQDVEGTFTYVFCR